ncbi:MAG: hypothetical protein Q7Q71_00040 [Verrucomicrobiota bacterium JB023]|nr:hypothetical protein [Verrucomicrobiota bacterium JB023]
MEPLPTGCCTGWDEKIQNLTVSDIDRIFTEWDARVERKDRWFSESSFEYQNGKDYKVLKVARCLSAPERGYFVLHTTADDHRCRVIQSLAEYLGETEEVEDSAYDAHVVKRAFLVPGSVAKQAVQFFAANGMEDPDLNWTIYEEVDPLYADET